MTGLTGEYEPSTWPGVRHQVDLYESTNGAEGATLDGLPVIIVTSRGAKSGKLRKTPLMRVEHEGTYAAVASRRGAGDNPFWYYNLLAHPHVELRDGAHTGDLTAREIFGEEKSIWWERCVTAYPQYALFQARTERTIPIFLLEPNRV